MAEYVALAQQALLKRLGDEIVRTSRRIKVLEEMRIPVDCIAGTSVGALIASLYAAGTPLDVMERQAAETSFKDFGKWTVSSALVIGSMTPDFAYFLRLEHYVGFQAAMLKPRLAVWRRMLDLGLKPYLVSAAVSAPSVTATTATELDDAVKRLSAEGMTKMILDLRSNPGGLLDQAVVATDLAFRTVCLEAGAGLVVSEMVSSEGLVRGIDRTLALRRQHRVADDQCAFDRAVEHLVFLRRANGGPAFADRRAQRLPRQPWAPGPRVRLRMRTQRRRRSPTMASC